MSLVRDYSHYYQGTWIGLQEEGLLIPIFVESIIDESGHNDDDFSEEHRSQIMIHGIRYDRNNRGRVSGSRIVVPVLSPNLVLESPDVGYVVNGNDVRWTFIRPVRQRVKGMVVNKLTGVNLGRSSEAANMIYNLFNPSFDGMINRYMFVAVNTNNHIYYKGAEIGKIVEDVIHLISCFEYLVPQIRSCDRYSDTAITLVEAL